jgi:hypothetical protein
VGTEFTVVLVLMLILLIALTLGCLVAFVALGYAIIRSVAKHGVTHAGPDGESHSGRAEPPRR